MYLVYKQFSNGEMYLTDKTSPNGKPIFTDKEIDAEQFVSKQNAADKARTIGGHYVDVTE